MNLKSASALVIIVLLLASCSNEYQLKFNSPKTISVKDKLSLSINESNNKPVDSVRYYLDGKKLASNKDINLADYKLGKHSLSAVAFYEGTQKQLINTIYFLAAKAPEVYTYEIVNEYPHDADAFTQGLEYHNGFLYESTGQNGKSSLRKVDIKTGEVFKKYDLDKQYFGEGMTIFGNKIYMLTWQKRKGFIFDLETFEKLGEFNYGQSKEGWGLSHTSDKLVKTDGTEKIWFLNPENQKEEYNIQAYKHDGKVIYLNEIELINNMIYANRWQKNGIAIINPKTGAVEGVVNLKGLQAKAGQKGDDNVLNGIAYDAENDRMFVTGKNWNKLFEIKIKKK